jgi:hypothetical protein
MAWIDFAAARKIPEGNVPDFLGIIDKTPAAKK